MKKYIMIFSSVILAIMILLMPSNKVKAYNLIYGNNTFDIDTIYEDLKSHYSAYSNIDNCFFKVVVKDGDYLKFYLFTKSSVSFYDKETEQMLWPSVSESSAFVENSDYYLYFNGGSWAYGITTGSANERAYSYNYNLTNGTISYVSYINNYNGNPSAPPIFPYSDLETLSSNEDLEEYVNEKIVYSNVDIRALRTSPSLISYIRPYDTDSNNSSNIIIDSNLACDINNIDVRYVTINFGSYDSSYIYQFRTSYGTWVDISDKIYEASLYGVYFYRFDTYYNGTIDARILDSSNRVIDITSYTIVDLSDYGVNYIWRRTYDNVNYEYLGSIVLENYFNELNVTHNFRLEYLANDHDPVNMPNYINYDSYIIDINGFILNYDFSDYFVITTNEYQFFQGDYETYLDGSIIQIKDLPSNAYGYKIYFNFDNIGNYTIEAFDNFKNSDSWSYVNQFASGYTKVIFPSDYDTAIIRSKNFQDISDSSIIFLNVMFNSSEFGLDFSRYDFINSYSYSSYIKNSVNKDYSKIFFDIDETNKVFPVLYKPIGNSNVSFYIKNDCFVQFYKRSDMSSYIVGIDDNTFNSNNNLVVDSGFNSYIESNYNSNYDESTFFNLFESAFSNFKGVIFSIFSDVTYFFDNMPIILRHFFIVVFVLILTIFIIRFIL